MKIGIIGAGNMGGGLGKLWAAKGHEILFSAAHDATHLADLVLAAGENTQAGSPADAAKFGDVVLLTVRWPDRAAALEGLDAALAGKTLISCLNPFKPDFSGLEIGTTTSGAQEVAKMVPHAHVVECLFVNATVVNSPTRQFGEETPTVFYCGDDAMAKGHVAQLLADIGVEPMDAGPLEAARYLEPYAMLLMMLGKQAGWTTDFSMKLLRR
jgi:predicted dinucleotide-binding enzyme